MIEIVLIAASTIINAVKVHASRIIPVKSIHPPLSHSSHPLSRLKATSEGILDYSY
jgi:hypothetical protein